MKHTTMARAALAATIGAAGLLALPATASAEQTDAAETCEVTGGSLSWGIKESFRAYISGSIANGSWETSDGATYETPSFGWTPATGSIDPQTGAGQVSFTGTVHFTGHDGILDMTLANPTVQFGEDGNATLLLDTRGTDTSGAVAVDVTQEPIAELGALGPIDAESGTATFADVPVALSEQGAPAFADFYAPGEALDPLTVSFEFACAEPEPEPTEEAADDESDVETTAAESDDSSGTPWLPIGIGAAVVVVVAGTGTALYLRRRGNQAG
ncbi:HtaA domain-containing protein [Aeromicrobium sp. YIM 150415]|uniref:HtaA domain-containing protein n=1 Tax=Aeromicrobium sp. YIM 150415 TaxID=2803912 RepID=UPI0019632566|nr:HtaA domain-containing protein [Aeromicrobium sp. YIM 150415]MBM9465120.1 HtaA domain-containing protein [Aeromicrobium sp. YIM 150415]